MPTKAELAFNLVVIICVKICVEVLRKYLLHGTVTHKTPCTFQSPSDSINNLCANQNHSTIIIILIILFVICSTSLGPWLNFHKLISKRNGEWQVSNLLIDENTFVSWTRELHRKVTYCDMDSVTLYSFTNPSSNESQLSHLSYFVL